MCALISREDLLKQALLFLDEERQKRPQASLEALLDEAGARFNLSPRDAQSLLGLFQEASQIQSKGR